MLVLPRGNGWEFSIQVTSNDYAHTCLSPSGIIVSTPDSPYFLLFVFYRHGFHLLHKPNLIVSIQRDQECHFSLLPEETVWNCHVSGVSASTPCFSSGLRQHFAFINSLMLYIYITSFSFILLSLAAHSLTLCFHFPLLLLCLSSSTNLALEEDFFLFHFF